VTEHGLNESPPHPLGEEGRELAERVEELVRDGRQAAAQRAFSAGWRETVPELPYRFSRGLRKLNRQLLDEIAIRLAHDRGRPPELSLLFTSADLVAVRSVDDDDIIGYLKPKHARLLNSYGDDARLYVPHLLTIGIDHRRMVDSVTIELVRPELRVCSSCGARHSDAHVNCAACRAKRRKKGPDEKSREAAPVAFQEAIEALTAKASDDDHSEDQN
jgi:hypothetical protein